MALSFLCPHGPDGPHFIISLISGIHLCKYTREGVEYKIFFSSPSTIPSSLCLYQHIDIFKENSDRELSKSLN